MATTYATLNDAIIACTADVRQIKALEARIAGVDSQLKALSDAHTQLTDQLAIANQTLTDDLAQARALA